MRHLRGIQMETVDYSTYVNEAQALVTGVSVHMLFEVQTSVCMSFKEPQ